FDASHPRGRALQERACSRPPNTRPGPRRESICSRTLEVHCSSPLPANGMQRIDKSIVSGAIRQAHGCVYCALSAYLITMAYKFAFQNAPPEELSGALAALESVVLGKRREIALALVCLIAGGHLLIEDVPGVGKT